MLHSPHIYCTTGDILRIPWSTYKADKTDAQDKSPGHRCATSTEVQTVATSLSAQLLKKFTESILIMKLNISEPFLEIYKFWKN